MTDYRTIAKFSIPCSQEQAAIALEAFALFADGLTPKARSLLLTDDRSTPESLFVRHCVMNHPGVEAGEYYYPGSWHIEPEISKAGIQFDDREMDTAEASVFTQAVLVAFDLPLMVEISAAQTSEPAEEGTFGGHACVVTKDYIRTMRLSDFLNAERSAHEGALRYFKVQMEERSGYFIAHHDSVMICRKIENPESRLESYFLMQGTEDDDGVVRPDDGGTVWDEDHQFFPPTMTEISAYDAHVLINVGKLAVVLSEDLD